MNPNNFIQLINVLQKPQTVIPPIQPPQQQIYILPVNQLSTQNTNPIFLTNTPIATTNQTNIAQQHNNNSPQNTKTVKQTVQHNVQLKLEKPSQYTNIRSAHHMLQNKYKCNVCFKSFSIKSNMIMH
eukprot:382165_1